jgi:hypothetical protein
MTIPAGCYIPAGCLVDFPHLIKGSDQVFGGGAYLAIQKVIFRVGQRWVWSCAEVKYGIFSK